MAAHAATGGHARQGHEQPLKPGPKQQPALFKPLGVQYIDAYDEAMRCAPAFHSQHVLDHPAPHDTRLCGNCGQFGNDLSVCEGPSDALGALSGCPLCNRLGHDFGRCPQVTALLPAALFHDLDVLRGNRPPIKTARDWVDVAIENEEVQAYPLTRKYPQRVVPSMSQKFGYTLC
jgi:hypothetical protein